MEAELGVTLEDWHDIPSHELKTICVEARRRCNGFIPANSLVLDIWDEEKRRRAKAARDKALYFPPRKEIPPRTPEEIEEINKWMGKMKRSAGL